MRNMLLLLAVALFAATDISAQTMLTQSSYPSSVIGTDSLKMTSYASSFPSLTVMTDGMWDMSTVTDTAPVFFAYRVPTPLGHQFADSNMYNLFGFSYHGNVQTDINSSAILEYAISVQKIGYSLTPVTGALTDSLFIDSQLMEYSLPRTKISFPCTYTSSWSSLFSCDLDFQLSLVNVSLSLSFNHTPGFLRRYTTESNTVTGWGKMSIKDASGSPSPYLDVLQVETVVTTVDSLFINGSPFSTILLLALNLNQGKVTTTYQQNYYRPGEVTALAQINFTDATYTQPKSAVTHIQRLSAVDVPTVVNENSFKVFPNPLTGNIVSIALPVANGTWSYKLADVNGTIISSGSLKTNGGTAQFSLPSSIPLGVYYLRLDNNGHELPVKSIEVLR